MTADDSNVKGLDNITTLSGRLLSPDQDVQESAGRELLAGVKAAVYPMCLKMLGSSHDANDAVADTVEKLLKRLHRLHCGDDANKSIPNIDNGTAYVRKMALNWCLTHLSKVSQRKVDRPLDDLEPGQVLVDPEIADTASDEADRSANRQPGQDRGHDASGEDPAEVLFGPSAKPIQDAKDLIARCGYTSERVITDLEFLKGQELQVVILRRLGYKYDKIATCIGAGMTAQNAQKRAERGLHKLRGRILVNRWRRREPPARWTPAQCKVLKELKEQVCQQLTANRKISDTLYRDIGKHFASAHLRRCKECNGERRDAEWEYRLQLVWLVIFALPLLGRAWPQPNPVPTAFVTDATTDGLVPVPGAPSVSSPPGRPPTRRGGRHNRRRLTVGAAALLLVLLGGAVVVLPRVWANATSQPAPGRTQAGTTGVLPVLSSPSVSGPTTAGVPTGPPSAGPTTTQSPTQAVGGSPNSGGGTGAGGGGASGGGGGGGSSAGSGGPYFLVFAHSSKCLDDPNFDTGTETQMDQWSCVDQANEKWYLDYVDQTYFRVRNAFSQKCLTLGGVYGEAPIYQGHCGDADQLFREEVVDGVYSLFVSTAPAHWVSRVLNISGAQDMYADNAPLILYPRCQCANEYIRKCSTVTCFGGSKSGGGGGGGG